MKKIDSSKIVILIAGILIGSTLVAPIEAKVATITSKWLKKYYYSKKQIKKSYLTKSQASKRFYSKNYINNLIAGYLTSSSAAGTYLKQSDASSNYLAKSGGTLTGGLTSPSYSFSSAQTKTVIIPGIAFQPEPNLTLAIGFNGRSISKAGGTASKVFATLSLPDGAVIKNVRFYVRDDSANNITNATIAEDDLDSAMTGYWSPYANTSSITGYGNVAMNNITGFIVDNSAYLYSLTAVFPAADAADTDLELKAVAVDYQISNL